MAKTEKNPNYVNGVVAPSLYELRVTGAAPEQGTNVVDLYWKARCAVDGKPGILAEVEAIAGFYVHAMFSDATLHSWERTPVAA